MQQWRELKKKEKKKEVAKEATDQAAGYILGAFGLVAGLAWNDAVQSLIRELFPISSNSVWAKFIYAVIITVVVVYITIWLRKILGHNESKK